MKKIKDKKHYLRSQERREKRAFYERERLRRGDPGKFAIYTAETKKPTPRKTRISVKKSFYFRAYTYIVNRLEKFVKRLKHKIWK